MKPFRGPKSIYPDRSVHDLGPRLGPVSLRSATSMLQRFARAVGWQDGARGSQDSQLLVPAGRVEAPGSTHRQVTEENENARPRVRFMQDIADIMATVPEDDEEPAGGRGDSMHEHLLGDAATAQGWCRDHRGKLQSVYELCEGVAQDAQDGGKDEADRVFRAAAEAREHLDDGVNRAGAQARPARPQAQEQLLSETPWPADRLVSGALELRGATHRTASDRQASCTIQHGVMTFRSALRPGAEMAVVAQVPVSDFVVTIVPDQTRKFSICNPEDIASTQVWCCATDQVARNKWLAVLHRLGVDLYQEYRDGHIQRVRRGVQQA